MSIKDAIAASGSGARTGKLPKIGDTLRGTVISAELRQKRDDDGKLEFWEDDNPKQQVLVLLQTDLDEGPDDDGKEDDGKRTAYVKWWGEQRKAFLAGIRAAGADDLYPGDLFAVKYIGDGEAAKKSWSAPKLLKFKITPKPKGAGIAGEVRQPVVEPTGNGFATARKPPKTAVEAFGLGADQ
ncbi:MAG: hypothetical protein EPO57_09210 [Chitinophagaceae bacterium]|nr:MAG: hypothetical protein EPO57_09210 [Chitinophagaceae bacterium]